MPEKIFTLMNIDKEKEHGDNDDETIKLPIPEKSFGGHSWLYAALQEEIQVCYGRHEMTADYNEE
eukprot:9948793-Ditylum_brightwellii.AAC.1